MYSQSTTGLPTTLAVEAACSDLLVNTTPACMWPHDEGPEASLWPEVLAFPPHLLAYDLIYRPKETKLLRQARLAEAVTINGVQMLVPQGERAFKLCTGQSPLLEVMWAAGEQALEATGADSR